MLAGSGFGYDRLFLEGGVSAPSPASAAGAPVAAGKRPAKADSDQGPSTIVDHSALAARLAALRPHSSGSNIDGFAIPASWQAPQASVEPGVSKPAPKAPEFNAEKLRITGVMPEHGAIMAGKFVRVGEASDGVVLVSVTKEWIVVRDQATGFEAILRIPAAAPSNPRVNVHRS